MCTNTQTNNAHCGTCGTVCPSGQLCQAGACTCSTPGLSVCASGACVDTRVDPANCGICSRVCTTTRPNAHGICTASTCYVACDDAFVDVAGTCTAITPPRPVWPLSGGVLTSLRPSFRWDLPARADGARVEICRDRACTMIVRTLDGAGETVRLPMGEELPPSSVLFWRLRGRNGTRTGAPNATVWQFTTRAASLPTDTAWGTALQDVNGDGVDDLVVGASAESRVTVVLGTRGVFDPARRISLSSPVGGTSRFGASVAVGDLDGDGYAEIVVGASFASRVFVYAGRSIGPSAVPTFTLGSGLSQFGGLLAIGDFNGDRVADLVVGATGSAMLLRGPVTSSTTGNILLNSPIGNGRFGAALAAIGDVDGDGFGDLMIGEDADAGRAYFYRGGTTGVPTAPSRIIESLGPFNWGWSVGGCGDFDGDGYGDAVIGSQLGSVGSRGLIATYRGSPSGLTTDLFFLRDGEDFGGGRFGRLLATGDLNGDQRGDLFVTADENMGGSGRGFLFPGVSGTGPSRTPTLQFASPDGGYFGGAATLSLDLNGDGYGDVVVAASTAMTNGVVYVYPGSATGPSTTPMFNVSNIGSSSTLFPSLSR